MLKRILITGATGLAGSEVIRQALMDDEISQVTALVRRPLAVENPKLKVVLHADFKDYSGLADTFAAHDACIWCLGISQTQVTEAEYIKITYDYVITAAQAMLNANPGISFVFLSGMGADSQEKSRTLFARTKGKAENNLKRLPFKQLFIARPGGIIPVHKKENAAFFEKLAIPFYPIIQYLAPFAMISSVVLAKALLQLAKHGYERTILENMALKRLVGVGI
jgi:uncharacterized protein YbjT (DUF2867 family)